MCMFKCFFQVKDRLNVYVQMFFPQCFIFTLLTGLSQIVMDRFNVNFQMFLPQCFIFTLITSVSDIVMNRLNVYFQIFLWQCFLCTLITGVVASEKAFDPPEVGTDIIALGELELPGSSR